MDNPLSSYGALPLRGKSDISEVIKHFRLLYKDGKNVLRGWVMMNQLYRENPLNQDIYSNHFEDLASQSKCSRFSLYDPNKSGYATSSNKKNNEVHIYFLPIIEKTIEFLEQINNIPFPFHFASQPNLFAFLIHIKQPLYTNADKINYSSNLSNPSLNPEVVMNLA